MKNKILLFIIPFFWQVSFAQTQQWPYGFGAAITVSADGTVTSSSSSLQAGEGSAAIQDKSGNLLFYTEGANVYDKNGTLINTTGPLFGTQFHPSSSTQSSAIIPLGDCKRFLIIGTPGVESTSPSNSTVPG